MEIVVLIVAMGAVGIIAGWLAGLIWKERSPSQVNRDYFIAVISTVVIGLIDWYVIPAMGFSDRIKYLGVALEPLFGALIVLWIFHRARH